MSVTQAKHDHLLLDRASELKIIRTVASELVAIGADDFSFIDQKNARQLEDISDDFSEPMALKNCGPETVPPNAGTENIDETCSPQFERSIQLRLWIANLLGMCKPIGSYVIGRVWTLLRSSVQLGHFSTLSSNLGIHLDRNPDLS